MIHVHIICVQHSIISMYTYINICVYIYICTCIVPVDFNALGLHYVHVCTVDKTWSCGEMVAWLRSESAFPFQFIPCKNIWASWVPRLEFVQVSKKSPCTCSQFCPPCPKWSEQKWTPTRTMSKASATTSKRSKLRYGARPSWRSFRTWSRISRPAQTEHWLKLKVPLNLERDSGWEMELPPCTPEKCVAQKNTPKESALGPPTPSWEA